MATTSFSLYIPAGTNVLAASKNFVTLVADVFVSDAYEVDSLLVGVRKFAYHIGSREYTVFEKDGVVANPV